MENSQHEGGAQNGVGYLKWALLKTTTSGHNLETLGPAGRPHSLSTSCSCHLRVLWVVVHTPPKIFWIAEGAESLGVLWHPTTLHIMRTSGLAKCFWAAMLHLWLWAWATMGQRQTSAPVKITLPMAHTFSILDSCPSLPLARHITWLQIRINYWIASILLFCSNLGEERGALVGILGIRECLLCLWPQGGSCGW